LTSSPQNQTDAAPRKSAALRKIERVREELGWLRLLVLAVFLVLAILVSRFSWDMILISNAERALYDLLASYLAPLVDQDTRIVKIVYNDDTLIDTKKRSPLDRAILANALANIDAMGAKAIGIDILFDQPQDEDVQLQSALAAMKTPTYLAYATSKTNQNNIKQRQQEFLDSFIASLKTTNAQPSSIRVESDVDNVVRSWPRIQAGLPPILSRAMAKGAGPEETGAGADKMRGYEGSIQFREPKFEDRPVFASLPIDLIANPEIAAAMADQIKGKYVLICGDIVDVDEFETPLRLRTQMPMIGLDVHAHMLAQLLSGQKLAAMPSWAKWALAVLVVLGGCLTSLQNGGIRAGISVTAQVIFFGGLPFWAQANGIDTQYLSAFGWLIGWVVAFAAVSVAVREVDSHQRRFAQAALGKYLPKDIAQQILDEPGKLALHGENREIFVVFSDLEGFTQLSHQIDPEMVATLLNRYLDMLCSVILKHGGTIDKFVGDATVSFWGAPISRPDDGERAAKAAYEIWQAGEEFRNTVPAGLPPIGKTRVGLHFGEAVIGNFGGEGRIQYTALGDSMNTAARLESANKQTKTGVLASREAMERTGLDWWRPMGRVRLRGRALPVDIFEPRPDIPQRERDHLAAIMSMVKGDYDGALADLEMMAKASPNDQAVENLLYRTQQSRETGVYLLE
jgi:adenylate cyclase